MIAWVSGSGLRMTAAAFLLRLKISRNKNLENKVPSSSMPQDGSRVVQLVFFLESGLQ